MTLVQRERQLYDIDRRCRWDCSGRSPRSRRAVVAQMFTARRPVVVARWPIDAGPRETRVHLAREDTRAKTPGFSNERWRIALRPYSRVEGLAAPLRYGVT